MCVAYFSRRRLIARLNENTPAHDRGCFAVLDSVVVMAVAVVFFLSRLVD
jgi:hypothetical protein